uniref:non-specific serine/threonine protein kinase n=1 Tax=Sander lucioperca TaxID=283035 RepID=A0A8C9XKU3_SANLU
MDVAKLKEYALEYKLELKYEDVGSVGPDHIKTFTVRAVLDGKAYPDGVGKNKKEAKQNAAKNALRGLLEEPIHPTENAAEAPSASAHPTSITQANYICWLNDYCQKNKLTIRAVESTRLEPNNAVPCCCFVIGDEEYPAATGKSRKEAKEEAAKLVHHEIFGSITTEPGEEKYRCPSSQPEEELDQNESDICETTKSLSVITKDEGFTDTNFIGLLDRYCIKTNLIHDYILENKCGLSHIPQFFYKVVINNKEYPVGEGKSVKEAKQKAAQLACSALQEETDWDSKTENAAEAPSASAHPTSITQANYICWLNDYCQKNKLTIRAVESTRLEPNNAIPCCCFVIGDEEYPAATGKSRKEAKEEAAKLVHHEIFGSITTEPGEEKYRCPSSQPEEELDQNESDICETTKSLSVITKDEGFTDTNFIGLLDRYCIKTNLIHDYILENKCGLSHIPQFFYKVVINNKEYPVGEGKSVKEAKQKAAQLACSALQEETDWDSKVFHIFQAAKDKNMGNNQNETSIHVNLDRFTSDFEPMECLGSGGFGLVYKARDKLLKKYYAVKIVCCEEKALREVKTLSDLLHRNIVRYYTVWTEDSGYQWDSSAGSSAGSYSSSQSSMDNSSAKYLYIQMELCNTKTLKDWIDEKNSQSPQDSKRREESLSIAQQIVSGVEYIHSKKHIHRDLKPANILFGLDGEVKIGDFGLVTTDDALMDRTENRGTPSYMAPEQKNYDRKVDIFALGLIYLELLWKVSTGHERRVVLDDARCQKLPKDFSKTFPQENNIIELMLREKPEDRPDASKLKAELEKWAKTFSTKNVRQENATV